VPLFEPRDHEFMRKALALAEVGRGSVEPNPVVGAVIVKDGRIIGEGYHQRYGGPHAEVFALRSAGKEAAGGTMYVTLEPCAHTGKTPPCAPQVASAGLARVVVAVLDPTGKTHGLGVSLLRRNGVRADVGLCREEAVRQNGGFFKRAATGRPLVTVKWAMSADGRISTRSGSSRWISGEESRAYVHSLRAVVDCIVVGAGTAGADDPLLTARTPEPARRAARLVVCGKRAVATDSQLARNAGEAPVLLAYPEGRPPAEMDELSSLGCEPVPLAAQPDDPERVHLPALLDELGARDMTNVLVEGGAGLLGGLFDAGLVDRAVVFVAPIVIGGGASVSPIGGIGPEDIADCPRMSGCTWRTLGQDMVLEGWLADPLKWVR